MRATWDSLNAERGPSNLCGGQALAKTPTQMIENWDVCIRERTNFRETLQPTEFPARPWSTVGADLFQTENNKHYLVIVDYFSRFFEVAKLTYTTSEAVVEHFKSIFARHGIPDVVRSDNGPQFKSEYFRKFVREWGFSHVTSSPHFPKATMRQSGPLGQSKVS